MIVWIELVVYFDPTPHISDLVRVITHFKGKIGASIDKTLVKKQPVNFTNSNIIPAKFLLEKSQQMIFRN